MNTKRSKKFDNSHDEGISVKTWFGYGAEFITIFFALTILAGRVYAQSYWGVFGLTPELVDTNIISIGIMSPNVAIASVIIAASTMIMIIILRQQSISFINENNVTIFYYASIASVFVGLLGIVAVLHLNTSSWTPGTAGLSLGIAFLLFFVGTFFWGFSSPKPKNKELAKWETSILGWLKNIPRTLHYVLFVICFIALSIWAITETAHQFGTNEAKFMYDNKPLTTLQLDSEIGFESYVQFSSSDDVAIIEGRIIIESGDFMYFSPGYTYDPLQLHVLVIPISRVQAIQYAVDMTPIGK